MIGNSPSRTVPSLTEHIRNAQDNVRAALSATRAPAQDWRSGSAIYAYGKNSTGVDLRPFDVGRINSLLNPARSMTAMPVYQISTPTASAWNRIAVSQQFVKNGAFGLFAIGGITPVRIQRLTPYTTNEKVFANIKPSETGYLVAGNVGPVRIMHATPFEIFQSSEVDTNTGIYEAMLTYPIDPQCTVKLVNRIARGKYWGRTFSYAAGVNENADLFETDLGDISTTDDALVVNTSELSTDQWGQLISAGRQPIFRATQRGLLATGRVVLELAGYPLKSCE